MNINITKLDIVNLKALKADVYEEIARNQNNLALLNQEIAKRQAVTPQAEISGEPLQESLSTDEVKKG